jgi:rhodanese-related sulfurtransferase
MFSNSEKIKWMKKLLTQSLILICLGVGLGLGVNQLSPRGMPWVPPPKKETKADEFIALHKAKELWGNGAALFVDAREPADYAAGHIGNAFNIPAQSFGQHFSRVAPMLTPDSALVLYCDGKECDLSHRLADNLRQQGYTNLHMLFNGWTAWRDAGLPTTRGDQP